jgi:hypothetical protein
MSKYIIVHDKLLDYGGAEVVLKSLVRFSSPELIVCSCVSNKKKWEVFFGIPIKSPKLTFFIKTQFLYKLFYPYIILVCSFSRIVSPLKGVFVLVYASSAGKYFRGFNFDKCLLYINYHAKGISNAKSYISSQHSLILGLVISVLKFPFLKIENLSLRKFKYIRTISQPALDSLPNYIKFSNIYNLGIIHCPALVPIFNRFINYSEDLPSEYFVIISRLNPEKSIEPLLNFLEANLDINIVVIGDGALFEYFKGKFLSRFYFLGFLEEKLKAYIISKSIGVIQPTSQEWSLVTIEANLIGVPVISAWSLGLEEINSTISGENFFPNLLFNNYSDISELIIKLPLAASYLKANNNHITHLFSEELFFQRLSSTIDEIKMAT